MTTISIDSIALALINCDLEDAIERRHGWDAVGLSTPHYILRNSVKDEVARQDIVILNEGDVIVTDCWGTHSPSSF